MSAQAPSAQSSDEILSRLMSLHPKVIDLSLDRMHRILAQLGHPERAMPPVTLIAGTNGKGSTLAMIRAGLEAAGQTCHAYTSPHLARFHERIRVAGSLIDEADLSAILAECETANGAENITYFEITTAAAFLAFSRHAADHTLLEVGLGGRLDATNVVTPSLTVITPVSLDHQQFLGDTVEQIAFEKAGILKPGVTGIIGPQSDAALEVIEACAAKIGAPLLMANRDWQAREEHGRLVYQDEHGLLDLPMPTLIGAHQIQNAGTALAGLRHLGAHDPESAVTRAIWPARLQRLRTGPLVTQAAPMELWLDGGHNPAAGEALAEAIGRLPKRGLRLICGMLSTKDIEGYLRPLAGIASGLHGISIPGETATLSAEQTVAAARRAGFAQASEAVSVEAAIGEIAAEDPATRVLICGSLYLAGHVLRTNG